MSSPDQKILIKKNKSAFEQAISRNNGNILVCWLDNAVVTTVATTYGIFVQRSSKQLKNYIQLTRPHLIVMYNKWMVRLLV